MRKIKMILEEKIKEEQYFIEIGKQIGEIFVEKKIKNQDAFYIIATILKSMLMTSNVPKERRIDFYNAMEADIKKVEEMLKKASATKH